MKKLFAIGLLTATVALGVHRAEDPYPDTSPGARLVQATQNELPTAKRAESLESAKLAADVAGGQTCRQFAALTDTETGPSVSAKVETVVKRITVSSLVSRALTDQMQLLQARTNDLDRWGRVDQAHFAKWFGTTSPDARETIYERIRVLTLLNKEYSVGNFRRAVPSRPGLFAFVHPTDPSKIFVDQAFVVAPLLGENSRPGTLTHEMSHFVLAGGTKDIAYGVRKCKLLARQNPAQALANADNFEFFVEKVR